MYFFLKIGLGNYWNNLSLEDQFIWSIAIVSSLLYLIYALLNNFTVDRSNEGDSALERIGKQKILQFFILFGWLNVGINHFIPSFPYLLQIMVTTVLALLPGVLLLFRGSNRSPMNKHKLNQKTGQVFKAIPPNQLGSGKVKIRNKKLLQEFNAVTIGHEIPPGVEIRITEILDDGTVIVEPIERRAPSSSPAASKGQRNQFNNIRNRN